MLNVSQAVKDKFQSDFCRKEIRITIGNTVLTNEAIYKDGFRLTEAVMDGAVEFVGCIASILEFKVSTLSLAKGNYKGQTVTAEVAVYFDDNTLSSYIPLFYGFVDECTKSADGYYQEFVCYDRLAYLSDEPGYNMYKAAFNGSSVDLETFRESIVRDCGMSVMSSQVLPNDDIIFKKRKRNKDITAMALLRHIAQINGTYGILNRDGQFEFRQIDDSALPEVVAYYRDLTYSDHVVKPVGDSTTNPPTGSITIRTSSQDAGVTVDWTNYQQYAGTDPGWSDESQDTYLVDDDDADVVVDSYIIEGNLIAYKLKKGKKQVIGANILANLGHDAVFREYSVKCNGLPYVECCDKVLFTKGDQSQIEFVVTKRVLEGVQNMTDTYSCTINAQDSNDKSFVSNVDGSTNSLGGSPNEALGLTEKTITENGTYSAMDDGAEGFSQVTVDVEGGGGPNELWEGSAVAIDFDLNPGDCVQIKRDNKTCTAVVVSAVFSGLANLHLAYGDGYVYYRKPNDFGNIYRIPLDDLTGQESLYATSDDQAYCDCKRCLICYKHDGQYIVENVSTHSSVTSSSSMFISDIDFGTADYFLFNANSAGGAWGIDELQQANSAFTNLGQQAYTSLHAVTWGTGLRARTPNYTYYTNSNSMAITNPTTAESNYPQNKAYRNVVGSYIITSDESYTIGYIQIGLPSNEFESFKNGASDIIAANYGGSYPFAPTMKYNAEGNELMVTLGSNGLLIIHSDMSFDIYPTIDTTNISSEALEMFDDYVWVKGTLYKLIKPDDAWQMRKGTDIESGIYPYYGWCSTQTNAGQIGTVHALFVEKFIHT